MKFSRQSLPKLTINTVLFVCLLFFVSHLNAQIFSNKVISEEDKQRLDSIAKADYPYMLPIWGGKAVALGFDIPYSAGLSINYLAQESEIVINNLQVGINNSPLLGLDEIVRFNDVTGTTKGINIRPDIWLFPFLNIYGIFAQSTTSTEVDFGVYVPNGETSESIFDYQTKAEFDATSIGFGITPTMGIGGGFLALDMNMSWTDIPELDSPAFSFVFGPRFGKSFNLKGPESSIAVWVGGFRVNLKSDTQGGINLSEVLPEDGNLNQKIDNGMAALVTKESELNDWYNGLSPTQQRLNQIKYDAALLALGKANDLLSRLDNASDELANSTIRYSLDKKLKDKWNFIVGSQLQINKHWMVRAEFGFLKSRKQLITGLQYRFGL